MSGVYSGIEDEIIGHRLEKGLLRHKMKDVYFKEYVSDMLDYYLDHPVLEENGTREGLSILIKEEIFMHKLHLALVDAKMLRQKEKCCSDGEIMKDAKKERLESLLEYQCARNALGLIFSEYPEINEKYR